MSDFALAIDLGGTNLRWAFVGQEGRILKEGREPVVLNRGDEGVISQLQQLITSCGKTQPAGSLRGIGLGVPSPIEPKKKLVLNAPNLPGWKNVPLVEKLQPISPAPVYIENDVNLFTLGEWWLGSGQGAGSVVGIAIGTGIGGGVVINGQLWRGYSGFGGEVGHLVIDRSGPPCGCGSRGCAEAIGSASGLLRRYQTISGKPPPASAQELFTLAEAGDAAAFRLIDEAIEAWAILINNICHLINPERVVLGGGLSQAGAPMWEKLRFHLSRYPGLDVTSNTSILPARLADRSSLFGAARLVFDS